jgi:hypothetical protein
VTVNPRIEVSRPLLWISFLQVSNGNRLYMLVGNFQHPLLETQPARLRLCPERSFFFWRQIECDSHNLQPNAFRLTQSLYYLDSAWRCGVGWGHRFGKLVPA